MQASVEAYKKEYEAYKQEQQNVQDEIAWRQSYIQRLEAMVKRIMRIGQEVRAGDYPEEHQGQGQAEEQINIPDPVGRLTPELREYIARERPELVMQENGFPWFEHVGGWDAQAIMARMFYFGLIFLLVIVLLFMMKSVILEQIPAAGLIQKGIG